MPAEVITLSPRGRRRLKAEAIAAAGLLDQGGIAHGLEDAVGMLAHVIFDGQHKTGGKLAQRRARAGEGGRIGEKAQAVSRS